MRGAHTGRSLDCGVHRVHANVILAGDMLRDAVICITLAACCSRSKKPAEMAEQKEKQKHIDGRQEGKTQRAAC